MGKKAISITLDNGNLLWLHARTQQLGVRSVSELVDQLVTEARVAENGPISPPRSVVGMVKIVDPNLFEEEQDWSPPSGSSSGRPREFAVRERPSSFRPSRRKPRRG